MYIRHQYIYIRSSIPDIHTSIPDVHISIPDIQSSTPDINTYIPDIQSSIPDMRTSIPYIYTRHPHIYTTHLCQTSTHLYQTFLEHILTCLYQTSTHLYQTCLDMSGPSVKPTGRTDTPFKITVADWLPDLWGALAATNHQRPMTSCSPLNVTSRVGVYKRADQCQSWSDSVCQYSSSILSAVFRL